MEEIFKPVLNYEGLYEVSNHGRIKSLPKTKRVKNNKFIKTKEKILKGIKARGYLFVTLYKDKNQKTRTIHQLVAESFLNHVPCGYNSVIDHVDNNHSNNFVNNLQIVSQRMNMSKDRKNKTSKYTGVEWNKARKKWRASIYVKGKYIYLGGYNTEEEAKIAYDNELLKLNHADNR